MSSSLSDLSSPPSSLDHEGHDEPVTPTKGTQHGSQTKGSGAKSKPIEYPADIPRLTRYGLMTYGINTGPLPDDTDWSNIDTPVIREQLQMRNIPNNGPRKEVIERLKNFKNYKHEEVQVRESQEDFGPISQSSSAAGKKRFWVESTDRNYVSAAKKAMQDRMYILRQYGNYSGTNEVSFSILGSGSTAYTVTINKKPTCDCPALKFRPRANCKHIIYILTHVLRAPAGLLPQRTLFDEELSKLIANAPKVRPTQAEIDGDPTMTDGIPKSKEDMPCPVCYQDFGDEDSLSCSKCGRNVHASCFAVVDGQNTGWGTTCPVCDKKWQATW